MARDIQAIKDEVESQRAAYLEAVGKKPESEVRVLTDKVRELQAELSAAISEGAEACEVCENAPLGMEQAGALSGRVVHFYEVGCTVCRNRRAQGFTREQAVENWNAGTFLPPKKAEAA